MKIRALLPCPLAMVFGTTMLISAALMFWVQPMLGKALLPRTGGVPAAWLVAMAFFQLSLLAGYVLAHLAARLRVQYHIALWLGLLSLAAFFLPPQITSDIDASSGPLAWQVFKALAIGTGVPFVALSMTSSTLQRLYASTTEGAQNPYVLFAASNFGSFLGLLAYPALIEPWTGLTYQKYLWSFIYALVGAGGLLALFLARRKEEPQRAQDSESIPWQRRLTWIVYAAVPSSLSMGFTDHVTTDIASAPLLWVLPLAIYLLTFVEAFSLRPHVDSKTIEDDFFFVAIPYISIILLGRNLPTSLTFALVLLTFSLGALALHKRLAALRPHAGRLTEFYVFVALGGAIGGCFNAFLAPLIFVKPVEFSLAALAGIALLKQPHVKGKIQVGSTLTALVGMVFLLALMLLQSKMPEEYNIYLMIFMPLALITLFIGLFNAVRLSLLIPVLAVLLMADFGFIPKDTVILDRSRNFFGSVAVTEGLRAGEIIRQLRHGTTLHGEQLQNGAQSREALTYFGPLSPVRDVMRTAPSGSNVIIVGLGAGSMACLVPEASKTVFIEIDPQIVRMAQKDFTFLAQCPPERIEVKDGRLGLSSFPDGQTDLLAIDAFSSDSVPAHMLTVEAMKLYARKLKPDGILVLHLSNRYLSLDPIVAAALREAGMSAKLRFQKKRDNLNMPSIWVAAALNAERLEALSKINADWDAPPQTGRAWTDDFTNILSALKFFKGKTR